jgi:hypothetical protein
MQGFVFLRGRGRVARPGSLDVAGPQGKRGKGRPPEREEISEMRARLLFTAPLALVLLLVAASAGAVVGPTARRPGARG